jgi:hypothetical protein
MPGLTPRSSANSSNLQDKKWKLHKGTTLLRGRQLDTGIRRVRLRMRMNGTNVLINSSTAGFFREVALSLLWEPNPATQSASFATRRILSKPLLRDTAIQVISHKRRHERVDVVVLLPPSFSLFADQTKTFSWHRVSPEQTGSVGPATAAIRGGTLGFAMSMMLLENHLKGLHHDRCGRLLQTVSCAVMNVQLGDFIQCEGSCRMEPTA